MRKMEIFILGNYVVSPKARGDCLRKLRKSKREEGIGVREEKMIMGHKNRNAKKEDAKMIYPITFQRANAGMPKGIFGTFGFEGPISENFQKKLGHRTADCTLQE